jgi:hypothetical protein
LLPRKSASCNIIYSSLLAIVFQFNRRCHYVAFVVLVHLADGHNLGMEKLWDRVRRRQDARTQNQTTFGQKIK